MITEVTTLMGIDHLLSEMAEIVLKKVERFQSEYFAFDTVVLYQAFKEVDELRFRFVWFVCEDGTHLYTIGCEGLKNRAEYLLRCKEYDVYFITKKRLVKLRGTKEEILEWMSPKGLYLITEVL